MFFLGASFRQNLVMAIFRPTKKSSPFGSFRHFGHFKKYLAPRRKVIFTPDRVVHSWWIFVYFSSKKTARMQKNHAPDVEETANMKNRRAFEAVQSLSSTRLDSMSAVIENLVDMKTVRILTKILPLHSALKVFSPNKKPIFYYSYHLQGLHLSIPLVFRM